MAGYGQGPCFIPGTRVGPVPVANLIRYENTILCNGLADLQGGHTEFQGDVSELPALLHAEISKINIWI